MNLGTGGVAMSRAWHQRGTVALMAGIALMVCMSAMLHDKRARAQQTTNFNPPYECYKGANDVPCKDCSFSIRRCPTPNPGSPWSVGHCQNFGSGPGCQMLAWYCGGRIATDFADGNPQYDEDCGDTKKFCQPLIVG